MKSSHTTPPLRLNQLDTARLPVRYLLILVVAYIVPGLIWRGLWKQESASFGAMLSMAQGAPIDWILPNVAGAYLFDGGPLPYWIGGLFIKLFSFILSPFKAAQLAIACQDGLAVFLLWQTVYRLGTRSEMQPQRLAFGGEPSAQDYSRMLADCAALLFIATYGIAAHTHDTSIGATQLMVSMLWLFGASNALRRPNTARWFWGLGLAGLALSVPFALFVVMLLVTLVVLFFEPWRSASIHSAPVVVLIGVAVPALWFINMSQFPEYAHDWMTAQHIAPISKANALFFVRNIFVFTWPLWPLAGIGIWKWRHHWHNPALFLGLIWTLAPLIHLLVTGQRHATTLLMLTPGLLILAPFGLATLNRGRANIIDWFSLLTFSVLATAIWMLWEASWMGYPAAWSRNIYKLTPDFVPVFRWLPFIFATLVSLLWALLLSWRIRFEPRALWKSVVLSSAGLVMVWVLLATLAMPWLDYTRSYERMGKSLAQNLPTQATCVHAYQLGLDVRGAMHYYAKAPFLAEQAKFNHVQCPYVLTTLSALNLPLNTPIHTKVDLNHRHWQVVWSGEREGERKSKVVLLRAN